MQSTDDRASLYIRGHAILHFDGHPTHGPGRFLAQPWSRKPRGRKHLAKVNRHGCIRDTLHSGSTVPILPRLLRGQWRDINHTSLIGNPGSINTHIPPSLQLGKISVMVMIRARRGLERGGKLGWTSLASGSSRTDKAIHSTGGVGNREGIECARGGEEPFSCGRMEPCEYIARIHCIQAALLIVSPTKITGKVGGGQPRSQSGS
mmetsp:Transcript_32353/g.68060  ORF Transcript_32353/g.68060 Transcript_32353/m.68060 type:complete len:205 (+) Transcript_32353:1533-2147(+)